MKRIFAFVTAAVVPILLAASLSSPLLAQSSEKVKFSKGNDNAAVEGSVTGDEYRDYVLGAQAGQTMAVSIITDDGGPFFNILPPGSDNVAIYNGSMDGPNASVKLPADGNYTIRVYLMGDAKDSNKTKTFLLSMTIM